jgi:hypothetical protein
MTAVVLVCYTKHVRPAVKVRAFAITYVGTGPLGCESELRIEWLSALFVYRITNLEFKLEVKSAQTAYWTSQSQFAVPTSSARAI